MSRSTSSTSVDVQIAVFCDVDGWGGAVTAARGVAEACVSRGLSTLRLGTGKSSPGAVDIDAAGAQENAPLKLPAPLWRCRSWLVPGVLEKTLRAGLPPRRAFVALSPFWVVAAKQAWPSVPVVYLFPCLLTNCVPFCWPRRRPPTLWKWLDWAGIRRTERRAFRLADLTLVPTQRSCDEVLRLDRGARRIEVCTYGTRPQGVRADLRRAQRERLTLPADAFVVLAVGLCDLNKAFDWAVNELPRTEERVHLVIVGDGPERGALARLVEGRSLSGRVHLVGAHADMAPWYALADCVVSTSFYDTFPNAVLEGMYHGLPVVVPEHDPPRVFSGVAEVIEQSGGGVCYDRCRPGALAACLNRLVRDRWAAVALGADAQRVAQERFRWEKIVERVVALADYRIESANLCRAGPPRRAPLPRPDRS